MKMKKVKILTAACVLTFAMAAMYGCGSSWTKGCEKFLYASGSGTLKLIAPTVCFRKIRAVENFYANLFRFHKAAEIRFFLWTNRR